VYGRRDYHEIRPKVLASPEIHAVITRNPDRSFKLNYRITYPQFMGCQFAQGEMRLMQEYSNRGPILITITRITIILIALILAAAAVFTGCGTTGDDLPGGPSNEPEYAKAIFGTPIIAIDIQADAAEWQTMLDNATKETYIRVTVVVNGTTFKDVGIRPKGNSSLSQVAASTSDRFSFRLKFDEYVEDQTCFGLDTFVINNMFGDYTYMKEYICYDMMRTAGVDAPCFGYAAIRVNDQAWGLYLAVEAYNNSFQQRVSGDDSGNLYNVKMTMGNQGFQGNPQGLPGNNGNATRPTTGGQTGPADSQQAPAGQQQNWGGKMGAGNSGGSLLYTDDNPSSYSSIFDNAIGSVSEKDKLQVIAALKALSSGENLADYFDIDAILRYFAAHTIVVNLDSYSSAMAQNYYIYERKGQITILPWDYNLSWGGFMSGTASAAVNFPIDTPVRDVSMAARPLLDKLLGNDDYLSRYHAYMQDLIDNYFADGRFAAKVSELNVLIAESVREDPTAFCTAEQYDKAIAEFIKLGNLRAESVQGQLDGSIPRTTAAQQAESGKLIDASSINLTTLGSMGRGGPFAGGFGAR
jgi:hypothetical protein